MFACWHRSLTGHNAINLRSHYLQEQVRAVAQGGGVLGGPPPPLQATPPKRKEEDKSGSFGLVPQVAVGAISLALVGVLVLTSIGDSPAPPSKQVQILLPVFHALVSVHCAERCVWTLRSALLTGIINNLVCSHLLPAVQCSV